MKTYLRFKGYNPLTLDLLGAPYNILISVTGNLAKKISQRVSKAGVMKKKIFWYYNYIWFVEKLYY